MQRLVFSGATAPCLAAPQALRRGVAASARPKKTSSGAVAEPAPPPAARKQRSSKAKGAKKSAEDAAEGEEPEAADEPLPARPALTISDARLPWAAAAKAASTAPAIKPQREKRAKAVPIAERFRKEVEAMEATIVKYDENGIMRYDRSVLGEGKLHTYALAVFIGKEERFVEFMNYRLQDMPPVIDVETGIAVPRVVEWEVPTKTIKVFSEKSLKWSNKAIPYKQGGWVFMKAVLDEALVEQVTKMIYFQYWRNAMTFTLPESAVIAPQPCPPEQLADVEAWKVHKQEQAEQVAKCKEYGGEVDVEIFNKVIRRDEMKEDLDVNDFGEKIYKKDYTGTYVNPNAFYEGQPAADTSGSSGSSLGSQRGGRDGAGGERSWSGDSYERRDSGSAGRGSSRYGSRGDAAGERRGRRSEGYGGYAGGVGEERSRGGDGYDSLGVGDERGWGDAGYNNRGGAGGGRGRGSNNYGRGRQNYQRDRVQPSQGWQDQEYSRGDDQQWSQGGWQQPTQQNSWDKPGFNRPQSGAWDKGQRRSGGRSGGDDDRGSRSQPWNSEFDSRQGRYLAGSDDWSYGEADAGSGAGAWNAQPRAGGRGGRKQDADGAAPAEDGQEGWFGSWQQEPAHQRGPFLGQGQGDDWGTYLEEPAGMDGFEAQGGASRGRSGTGQRGR